MLFISQAPLVNLRCILHIADHSLEIPGYEIDMASGYVDYLSRKDEVQVLDVVAPLIGEEKQRQQR